MQILIKRIEPLVKSMRTTCKTTSKAIVTCENIKRGIEKVKKMFPTLSNLSCELRFEYTDNENMHASNQDKEMEVGNND